jgi:hypothetical protein
MLVGGERIELGRWKPALAFAVDVGMGIDAKNYVTSTVSSSVRFSISLLHVDVTPPAPHQVN